MTNDRTTFILWTIPSITNIVICISNKVSFIIYYGHLVLISNIHLILFIFSLHPPFYCTIYLLYLHFFLYDLNLSVIRCPIICGVHAFYICYQQHMHGWQIHTAKNHLSYVRIPNSIKRYKSYWTEW